MLKIFIIVIAIIIVIILIKQQNKKEKARKTLKETEDKLMLTKILEEQKIRRENLAKEKWLSEQLISAQNSAKIAKEKREKIALNIDFAYSFGEITEGNREKIIEVLNGDDWEEYDFVDLLSKFKAFKLRYEALSKKYNQEIASKIMNQEYWIGMTIEQLIECKGNPDKIERVVLKTKEKLTYIYDGKRIGDYFVIENGLVVKIVDR